VNADDKLAELGRFGTWFTMQMNPNETITIPRNQTMFPVLTPPKHLPINKIHPQSMPEKFRFSPKF
jgi:hypothetical protein